jgi:predicted transposase YdaD
MHYDTTLKELLRTPPIKLIALLTGAPPAELLTIEFPAVKMRKTDLIFRQPDEEVHHFELQSENDTAMDYRMLEYYPLLCLEFGRPPQQTVLYVGNEPLRMKGRLDHPRLRFSYRVIDIREFDAEPLLESDSPADNLLALLCRNGASRTAVRRILRKLRRLPQREQADRLVQLFIISGLRRVEPIVRQEAQRMPITVDLMENEFFRDAIINAKQEGKREGKQEGKQEGGSAILRMQLAQRFGKLPKWALTQLATADAATLEQWGLRLLSADKLEDVLPRASAPRRKTSNGHTQPRQAKQRMK